MKHFIMLYLLCGFCAISMVSLSRAESSAADTWSIDSGPIDPANYFGETVANGKIGLLSAPTPFRTQQTLINGVYETLRPGYASTTLSGFNFLNIDVAIDGERIDRAGVDDFRQKLNFKDAVLTASFTFKDKALVEYHLRALRQMPHTALLEVIVVAKRPIKVSVTTRLDEPHADDSNDLVQTLTDVQTYDTSINSYRSEADPKAAIRLRAASGKTTFGRHTIAAAQGIVFEEPVANAPIISHASNGLAFEKDLIADHEYRFGIVGSTLTSADARDPLVEAQHLTTFAICQGSPRLIAQHQRDWAELWESDVIIEGDDATQRDVHSMLYHLYSSIREGSRLSISPMGLSRSATGYLGHVYWDADTWIFPALLALHPPLAKAMIDYRYDRLPAAKRRAANHGYRGALFPWESSDSGDDDTPSSSFTGELQHHISADVALAAWQYYLVTQDRSWLRDEGFPLIRETADFWTSRVERNGVGRYDIENVVAADEYAENVDNNAFTNAAARENLRIASVASRILGVAPHPDWELVRENIPILKFPDGVTREHATYQGEQIKQPDVTLLAYPLREITDPLMIRRDLDYYSLRLDDQTGPSYGKAACAILYQRLDEPEKAYQIFRSAYVPNMRPPFGAIAECANCKNPYMVTVAGSLLQTMIYGFGGIEISDEGLVQTATNLPHEWKSLILTNIGPKRLRYVVSNNE